MSQYSNTLGIIVANGAMSTIYSTALAPMIKTVVRDVKKYMATAKEVTGQRELPIGYSASTGRLILKTTFDYFTAGKADETVDFFCVRPHSCFSDVARDWSANTDHSMRTSTGAVNRRCTSLVTSRSSRHSTTHIFLSFSPSMGATWARAANAFSKRLRPSTHQP